MTDNNRFSWLIIILISMDHPVTLPSSVAKGLRSTPFSTYRGAE